MHERDFEEGVLLKNRSKFFNKTSSKIYRTLEIHSKDVK
jgi:hypothetical protein